MSSEQTPARASRAFSAPDASLTINEFCQAEKISRSMLYRASEGWGPRFYWVGVTRSEDCHARDKRCAVNGFCPDGYVPTQGAIIRAAQYWFPDGFAALERAAVPPPETKPDNSSEALARALSPPPVIPDALRHEFQNIVNQSAHRLRNVLHQGKLKAYYFGDLFDKGRQVVSREFWATQEADGVLEAGIYWPFGRPNAWHERRPSYPLFLAQSELDALLSKQQTSKKRPFPSARKSQLVDTLRKLDQLPNRAAQLRALRDMPEFCEFKITEALFREAAKQVPRDPGRKSRRQS